MLRPFHLRLAWLTAAGLLVGTGCGFDGGAEAVNAGGNEPGPEPTGSRSDQVQESAFPVEIVALSRGSIASELKASANLEAETAVEVYARSEGLVRELYVEEGHRVAKGELLLRLEDDDQRNQLAKTQGQLDKARREYERQQRLFSQQLISEQVFNDATYEIAQLELAIEDAQRQLAHTEIRAPIRGTVTARLINEGDRVQPGVHLFSLVDFNSLVARIYVPEKELSRLRPGLNARVASQALSDRRYTGRLDRVAPVIDAKSGTIKATIAIGSQPGLLPGMYVDVSLVTEIHSNALLVPKRALIYDGDQAYVYRVGDDLRATRVRVVADLSNQDFIEPIGRELSPGDRVVVAGQAALKDGAFVRLLDAERDRQLEEGATR